MIKNSICPIGIAILLTGCSVVRSPDRIEVLHAQPITAEYEVKRGDTVNKISAAHNMDPEHLVALNGLEPPYTITVGQKLKVDGEDSDMIVVKQIFYN
jgi:lipoprotein YgeR